MAGKQSKTSISIQVAIAIIGLIGGGIYLYGSLTNKVNTADAFIQEQRVLNMTNASLSGRTAAVLEQLGSHVVESKEEFNSIHEQLIEVEKTLKQVETQLKVHDR